MVKLCRSSNIYKNELHLSCQADIGQEYSERKFLSEKIALQCGRFDQFS